MSRLAIALKQRGHDIVVLNSIGELDSGYIDSIKQEGITIHDIPEVDHWSTIHRAIRRIKKVIEQYPDADLIHTMGLKQLVATALAKRGCDFNKPIILTVHAARHGQRLSPLYYRLFNIIANRFADLILPVSDWWSHELQRFGLNPQKIRVVPNALDVENFDVTSGRERPAQRESIKMGYLAQLLPRKGHKYVIDAVAKVREDFPDIKVEFAGQGPLEAELKAQISKLGLNDKIEFYGQVQRSNIPALLSEWDIGLMPSLSETFGHALIEPMCAGLAVIATPTGVAPDILKDGENALTVPFRDSEAIANAILRLIENPEMRIKMGQQARRTIIERFSLENVLDLTEKAYLRVCNC